MKQYHGNTVEHWRQNAEENYMTTPISVLKYITVLEEVINSLSTNPNTTSEICGHYFAATKNGFLPCEFCSEPHPTYPITTVK